MPWQWKAKCLSVARCKRGDNGDGHDGWIWLADAGRLPEWRGSARINKRMRRRSGQESIGHFIAAEIERWWCNSGKDGNKEIFYDALLLPCKVYHQHTSTYHQISPDCWSAGISNALCKNEKCEKNSRKNHLLILHIDNDFLISLPILHWIVVW